MKKPLQANYDPEEAFLLNWCDAIQAIYDYIEDNKEQLIQYLPVQDQKEYDRFFNLLTDYYTSDQLFKLSNYDEEGLENYYHISAVKARYIIEEQFPFNLVYRLRDTANYPIAIEGDLIPKVIDGLKQWLSNPEFIDYTSYGFEENQIDKMLEVFGFNHP